MGASVSLPEYRAEVAEAMAAIAAGNPDGFEALFRLATSPVRRLIGTELAAVGIEIPFHQLDELTRSAVVDVAGLAGSWRPDGGALPWNWARQRVIAGAFNALGGLCDSLTPDEDAERREEVAPPIETVDDGDLAEALTRLAGCVPEAEMLQSGLCQVASERDRMIWLEYVAEQAVGNPAPAGPVARAYGLTESNVRKIVQRVRKALRELAVGDPSYQALGRFSAVAA
jgi:hypothetical protein